MDQILELIIKIDIINYSNYFLVGFIGSAAGLLKGISDKEIPKDKIIPFLIYNGIMGGFTGMLMTGVSESIAFNYAVSGIAGGAGIEKVIEFVNRLKGIKFSVEGDKDDK